MTPERFAQESEGWIETLRRAGALIENIRPVLGTEGVSLTVIDPTQPFRICLPYTALLNHQRIQLTAKGFHLDSTELTPEFIGMWHQILAFTLSEARVKSLIQLAASLNNLPQDVRSFLGPLSMEGLLKMNDPVVARQKLLHARYLSLGGNYYLLPVLEFANHDRHGQGFGQDGKAKAVCVEGRANGEVLINYTRGDAFHFLATYHFPAEVNHAYSLPMRFEFGDRPVTILRSFMASERGNGDGGKVVIDSKGEIHISSVLLGEIGKSCEGFRRFEAAWSGAGLTHPNEVFEAVVQHNLSWLERFQMALQGQECIWGKWLQMAADQQRKIMEWG